MISPSHEVSLVVARPLADLEAALPNVTRAISSLAGIKVLCSVEQYRAMQCSIALQVRKSGVRQAGDATELRVYGVRSGTLLGGQVHYSIF